MTDVSIKNDLLKEIAHLLQVPPGDIDPDCSFLELGADSIMLVEAAGRIEARFGQKIPIPKFFDEVRSVSLLADYLSRSETPQARPPTVIVPAEGAVADVPNQDILQAQLDLIQHVIARQNQLAARLLTSQR